MCTSIFIFTFTPIHLAIVVVMIVVVVVVVMVVVIIIIISDISRFKMVDYYYPRQSSQVCVQLISFKSSDFLLLYCVAVAAVALGPNIWHNWENRLSYLFGRLLALHS